MNTMKHLENLKNWAKRQGKSASELLKAIEAFEAGKANHEQRGIVTRALQAHCELNRLNNSQN